MSSPPLYFRMHQDYSQLLSGAHKKPATPVGAPGVVSHLGFWQPDEEWLSDATKASANNDAFDQKATSIKWANRIDDYIRSIYCIVRNNAFYSPNTECKSFSNSRLIFLFNNAIDTHSPSLSLVPADKTKDIVPNSNVKFEKDNQSIVFIFVWHHIFVTLRFELHTEYFTITSFLDFSFKPTQISHGLEVVGKEISNDELDRDILYCNIINCFNVLNTEIVNLNTSIHNNTAPKSEDEVDYIRQRLASTHEFLYQSIWNSFFEEVLLSNSPLRSMNADLDGSARHKHQNLGSIFADFRGLILSPGESKPSWSTNPFRVPKWRDFHSTQPMGTLPFISSSFAQGLVARLWPFLTSEKRAAFNSFEFTVSRMLGGKAVYITALGAQPSPYLGSLNEKTDDQLPLYYLAYFHTHSRWETGRLIDRINHLGSVRIAAIKDVRKLRDTGTTLRGLSEPLDSILESLSKFSTGGTYSLRQISERLLPLQNAMAGLNREFLGGIHYRIERSRYYVKAFFDTLPALRIQRVEGFQPYDVFVQHRLGDTYGFIDRLGIRLQRFEGRIGVAYQSLLSLIGLKNTDILLEIQIAAELFVWVIAAPYYLAGLLEHLFEHASHFLNANDGDHLSKGAHSLLFALDLILAGVGICVWLWRRRVIKAKLQ